MKAVIILCAAAWICALLSCVECKCKDPCVCKDKGVDIDYRDVASHFARTNLTDKEDKYIYFISPCSPITCNFAAITDNSSQAAGCQYVKQQKSFATLGMVSDVEWDITNKTSFSVVYGGGDEAQDGSVRRVRINFVLNDSLTQPDIEFAIEDDSLAPDFNDYNFTLSVSSKAVMTSGGSVAGLAGLIIIILCILGVIAYLVIGSIIMYQVKGARGVEVIPNYTFWRTFPILVKDGFMFTISPCRKRFGKGYEAL